MKFSIIIPVYNVEKYLRQCLDSLQKQVYENFEVIIVNDGSPDQSQVIIDEFVQKDARFFGYQKENGGLSDARNYGVEKATGDYLLFVDGDDYVSPDYLKSIEETIMIDHKPDLIHFGFILQAEKDTMMKAPSFSNQTGMQAFYTLSPDSYFVTAWSYAYRREFWLEHQFQYQKGKYHEDYGLTPYVVLCAKTVSSIADCLYYYIVRSNSIMTSNDAEKLVKKANDTLEQYDVLKRQIAELKTLNVEEKQYVMSYLTNTLLIKGKSLPDQALKDFAWELKKREVWKYLRNDNLMRKVKRYLVKHHLCFYMKRIVK